MEASPRESVMAWAHPNDQRSRSNTNLVLFDSAYYRTPLGLAIRLRGPFDGREVEREKQQGCGVHERHDAREKERHRENLPARFPALQDPRQRQRDQETGHTSHGWICTAR